MLTQLGCSFFTCLEIDRDADICQNGKTWTLGMVHLVESGYPRERLTGRIGDLEFGDISHFSFFFLLRLALASRKWWLGSFDFANEVDLGTFPDKGTYIRSSSSYSRFSMNIVIGRNDKDHGGPLGLHAVKL